MKKSEFTLFIDTSNSSQTVVKLIQEGLTLNEKIEKTDPRTKSQNVLPLIEQMLHEHELKLSDLTEIEVNPGPGSFTGVRVGVSVANTLGWVLGIPVNGKKIEVPMYEKSKFD